MKQKIKNKLPVSNENLEKKSGEIISKMRKEIESEKELQSKAKTEIKKELKSIKETNIRMNGNTNAHIEEIKNQLANSVNTKFDYLKNQMDESKRVIDSAGRYVEKMSQQLQHVQAGEDKKIQKLEENVAANNMLLDKIYKAVCRQEKEFNQKIDRLEKLMEINRYGVTEKKREKQIVVSFTSYGKRISVVPQVLDRVFNQTLKPDRVVLYLSKENFPGMDNDLPERLLDMQQFGLEIRWCDGDIRSYKKIIPALEEFPDDIIITIDDDVYYELDFVEKLYNSYKKHPNAVSALRVHKMKFDDDKQLLSYNMWDSKNSELLDEESMQLFATGVGGVLYPPKVLHEDVLKESIFMEVCPNADDVWLKFMAILNGTPTVLADVYPGTDFYIEGTQEDSLWKSNVSENDVQIKKFMDRYDAYFEEKSLYDRININKN